MSSLSFGGSLNSSLMTMPKTGPVNGAPPVNAGNTPRLAGGGYPQGTIGFNPGQGTGYMQPGGSAVAPHYMVGQQGSGYSQPSSGGSQQYYGGQQSFGAAGGSSGSALPPTGGNTGTFTNINQPQPVYTPDQTQYAVNQAVADARSQANPRWQEKQFQTAGRTTDAGTMSAAAPQIGAQLANANAAMGMLPLQDYITNQNNLLGGQINQDNESLGQAQLLGNMNLNNQGNALSWLSTLTGPLMGSLLG